VVAGAGVSRGDSACDEYGGNNGSDGCGHDVFLLCLGLC